MISAAATATQDAEENSVIDHSEIIQGTVVDPVDSATQFRSKIATTTPNGHERMPDILRLEMLSLLHTKPLTGYELRKTIKSSFNHEISFGTLYPNLASLERAGLIHGQWVSLGENQLRRKRIFTLTDQGKNFLTENLSRLNRLTVAMQKMSV